METTCYLGISPTIWHWGTKTKTDVLGNKQLEYITHKPIKTFCSKLTFPMKQAMGVNANQLAASYGAIPSHRFYIIFFIFYFYFFTALKMMLGFKKKKERCDKEAVSPCHSPTQNLSFHLHTSTHCSLSKQRDIPTIVCLFSRESQGFQVQVCSKIWHENHFCLFQVFS